MSDTFYFRDPGPGPVLTAYCDETGTHGGALSVVWGGFVTDSEEWKRFGYSWQARLARDGLDHFHCPHSGPGKLRLIGSRMQSARV